MVNTLADVFVESVLETKKKYFGICTECYHTIIKEHKGYYCSSCGEEYVKCPVCKELVSEDEMTYLANDYVCKFCIEENDYGK